MNGLSAALTLSAGFGTAPSNAPSAPNAAADFVESGFEILSQAIPTDEVDLVEELCVEGDHEASPEVSEALLPSTPLVEAFRAEVGIPLAEFTIAPVVEIEQSAPEMPTDLSLDVIETIRVSGAAEASEDVEHAPQAEERDEPSPDDLMFVPVSQDTSPLIANPIEVSVQGVAELPRQVVSDALGKVREASAPVQLLQDQPQPNTPEQLQSEAPDPVVVNVADTEGPTTTESRFEVPVVAGKPMEQSVKHTLAPTPAAPAAPVTREELSPLTRNVMERIEALDLQDGLTRISLRPRGLGMMEFDLSQMADGRMRVAIRVENPLLLDALRAEGSALGQFMQEKGFNLSQSGPEFEQYQAHSREDGTELVEEDEPSASTLAPQTLTSGQLDIVT